MDRKECFCVHLVLFLVVEVFVLIASLLQLHVVVVRWASWDQVLVVVPANSHQ